MGVGCQEVEAVVQDEEERDYNGLRDFDAVYARQHVYALWAEHGDTGHVDVVEGPQVEELAKVGLQRDGNDDRGDVEVDKVDDEDGNRGQAGDPPLVAPADVKEVVTKAEESDCLEGDDGREVRRKLGLPSQCRALGPRDPYKGVLRS